MIEKKYNAMSYDERRSVPLKPVAATCEIVLFLITSPSRLNGKKGKKNNSLRNRTPLSDIMTTFEKKEKKNKGIVVPVLFLSASLLLLYFPPNQLETPLLALLAPSSTFLSNSSTFFRVVAFASFA